MFKYKKFPYDAPNIDGAWIFKPTQHPCLERDLYDYNEVDGGGTNSISRIRDVVFFNNSGKLMYAMLSQKF